MKKIAIVTAAARGIGKSFCLTLAEAGINVVGIDISDQIETSALVKQHGVEYIAVDCDVSDLATMRSKIDSVVQDLGHIDIVVANAGIYPAGPFDKVTSDDWRQVMRVNLDGIFATIQSSLPHLRRNKWGRIVVISSAAIWNGVPLQTPYVASKAALIGLVRSLAGEIADDGITINAISPGLTETENLMNSWPGGLFDWVVESQSIKRRMQAEDLASTLLYLIDDKSDFVTGQTLNVDGGFAKH
ncbi:MAG: SDR family oxidoreductase [Gammaproteobacteria bacterium]|nr:SDR family oxidoreductase [Gammaproteobacteria bacterium]